MRSPDPCGQNKTIKNISVYKCTLLSGIWTFWKETYPLVQPGGPCKPLSAQFYQDQIHLRGSRWVFSCADLLASPHQFAGTLAGCRAKEKELGCESKQSKNMSARLYVYILCIQSFQSASPQTWSWSCPLAGWALWQQLLLLCLFQASHRRRRKRIYQKHSTGPHSVGSQWPPPQEDCHQNPLLENYKTLLLKALGD